MAVHGTERDAQRRHDLIRTDIMDLGTRIAQVEDQINALNRRLDEVGQPDLTDERFGLFYGRSAT